MAGCEDRCGPVKLIFPLCVCSIAHIYKFKNDEMKFLHNPDLRLHTIHVHDISRALLATAEWMGKTGRTQANELAGEGMPSAWAWSKGKGIEGEVQGLAMIKDVQGAVAENGRVVVPYFNVVSEACANIARNYA